MPMTNNETLVPYVAEFGPPGTFETLNDRLQRMLFHDV